jgi:fructokinase
MRKNNNQLWKGVLDMHDVVALGELLIDFTGSGSSAQGNPIFEANPGGAPCNVLAMLAKLGYSTAFIGKVGADMFGNLLKSTIVEAGIDASGLVIDEEANTTLAFVQTAPDGDRNFSFFRKPGADTRLRTEEAQSDAIENCKIFHFGSLSLTHEPARTATQNAVFLARKSGALISFDPNLRPVLWGSLTDAKEQILWGCAQCDILKAADEELQFLYGCTDITEGASRLQKDFPNVRMLFATKGKHGSEVFFKGIHVALPTYTKVRTIDTTGAGDAFCGCCLAYLLERGINSMREVELTEMLRFANAAASIVTTRKGAIRSMPRREEIETLMSL